MSPLPSHRHFARTPSLARALRPSRLAGLGLASLLAGACAGPADTNTDPNCPCDTASGGASSVASAGGAPSGAGGSGNVMAASTSSASSSGAGGTSEGGAGGSADASSSATTSGAGGEGGAGSASSSSGGLPGCFSNADCTSPTPVCDLATHECVECLTLADCGGQPGTVCDDHTCGCPGFGLVYCGPFTCVDITSNSAHCSGCGFACADGTFCKGAVCIPCPFKLATKMDYGTGMNPRAIASADLTADGVPDLVTANPGNNTISLLAGNGNGTFGPKWEFASGTYPNSITIADVHGDGMLDALVGLENGNAVGLHSGQFGGNLGSFSQYAVGLKPRAIATGDFNADGKIDIVSANMNSSSISYLRNLGGSSFAAKVDFATGVNPTSVVAADLNGDGKLDVATGNVGTAGKPTLSVLLGKGDGTFLTKVEYATGVGPAFIAAADVNADGALDLVTANNGNNLGKTVSVLLGKGDGTFGAKADFATTTGPHSVAAADLNGDGKVDLAVSGSGLIGCVLFGNGDGTFQPKVDFPAGPSPYSLVAKDFNGDGRIDLATANMTSHTTSVILNQTCAP